ncbi:MAG TPA: sugar ABC transporter permease [Pseudonocardiaceae bacterium]|nr:sugar ABC transporter permease [Pseudonocardiaceae bacterium]
MGDRTVNPSGTAARAGRTPVRPARRSRHFRTRLELVILLGPALIVFVGFVLVPIAIAAYYGFYNWSGYGPLTDFVGLQNYHDAVTGTMFQQAILHNVIFAVLSVIIQLPLSVGLAFLLNRKMHGRRLLRVVVFAPYVLSEAITAVIWLLILQPGGFMDQVFRAFGLGGLIHLWLASTTIVLYTLFVVATWKFIGFGIILLLAGLQGIPTELREAAALDGASAWQGMRHVTLPLLGPTIRIWIFLSVIGSLQLFDMVWIMTLGGPAGASTTMVTYLIDHGFKRNEFGYGSAVAVLLFAICFLFALLYQRFALRRDTDGALTRPVG